MIWTIFMLLRATPHWLGHTITERDSIAADCLAQAGLGDLVSMRFYDAEAFSGTCSDVAVFETRDLRAYYFVVERLRNTPLFGKPYFDVIDIIPALENGHQTFQREASA
tara:strand:+ start:2671 stop:2997 length:327 start_codon:yes stop_codon:yes gene_type:complete